MSVLAIILPMAGFTLAGAFLRRRGLVGPDTAAKLNWFVLALTLPAGIFEALHVFALGAKALKPPAVVAVLTFVLWGLAAAASRLLRLTRGQAAVFQLAVIFANTAYIGFPVIALLYGREGLAQAVLIDQLSAKPLAFTLGAFLAAHGASDAAQPIAWRAELRALLMFPPLLALAAGLLWQFAGLPPLPEPIRAGLRGLSVLTVPLVMIALGFVIRLGALRTALGAALVVVALRLVVSPALALGAGKLLGLEQQALAVTTLESGMPTMIVTLVLALRYRLDVELCAALITVTMIAGCVTLPLWHWLAG